jgi:D-alanine transaminase
MSICYVNGRYLPLAHASVNVQDRGYQFADGIYEVIAVKNGQLWDEEWHLDRLERSLAEVQIAMPCTRPALKHIIRQVIQQNCNVEGGLYLQVSRGVASRDFAFPKPAPKPSLVVYIMPRRLGQSTKGVRVITIPDMRWKRCDIKSIALLAPVLGKQQAKEAGAFEAWQYVDGIITEGTSSNAWIVKNNTIITHPASPAILNGITRMRLLALAKENGIAIEERPFTVAEAHDADEAFASASTMVVVPIIKIDDAVIGNGNVGALTMRLRGLYEEAFKKLITD